ncbi:hypothetical protein M0Q50_06445 [bacterium]|jgi:hypothetical protein|nr:hypothetical protein [bacterium]
MIGQINRGSLLGEHIYNLSKKDDVNTIVEIGTWNGMGSTKCIYDAVINSNKDIWSLECNESRYKEAKTNLILLPKNFKLIYGTITKYDELVSLLNTINNETLIKWLKEDLFWIKKAPFINLPEKIDLCILDGGEFAGFIEFMKLYKRCKYMILDDTTTFKHSKSREFILNNNELFEIIDDNIKDRNGYMVIKIKDV